MHRYELHLDVLLAISVPRKMLRFRSVPPLPEKFHEILDLMEVCLKLVTSTTVGPLYLMKYLCVWANIFVFFGIFGNVREKVPIKLMIFGQNGLAVHRG
jgi:hypothetical protein